MFELDRFIEDCKTAVAGDGSHKAVRELVAAAVADRPALIAALGEPTRGSVGKLYQSDRLTILNLVWAPGMVLLPHNHNMWAVIGLYSGREDNIFWRRRPDDASRVEAAGAKALEEGDTAPLGRDVIHSVINPLGRCTGALHVYGGDFFAPGRSEWDPETLTEGPYDTERNMRLFEEANRFIDA